MKIILCGESRTGKTTLGNKIADRFNLYFIPSYSTTCRGNQTLVLGNCLLNHEQIRVLDDLVADRCVLDVYAYEKTYHGCDRLKALVWSLMPDIADALFIVMAKKNSENCYAFNVIEVLNAFDCDYVLTVMGDDENVMESVRRWNLGVSA